MMGNGHELRRLTRLKAAVQSLIEHRGHKSIEFATGKSGLVVVDIDHGLSNESDLRAFLAAHDVPETFTVRTGRRFDKDTGEPVYCVQLYFSGMGVPTFNKWKQDGRVCSGQPKKTGPRYKSEDLGAA